MSSENFRVDGAGPKRRVEVRRDVQAPIHEVWDALVDADAI